MIEGMDIISKTEILGFPMWAKITLGIAVAILIVDWGITTFADYQHPILGLILVAIVVTTVTSTIIFSCVIFPEHTGKYEYEVRLNDSLDWSEFNDLYEIIEQKDDVYIIRDK